MLRHFLLLLPRRTGSEVVAITQALRPLTFRLGRGPVTSEALEVHNGRSRAGRPERPPVEDGGKEGREGPLLILNFIS